MTQGIYCFIDKETGIVVYIGRFTGRKRIKEHYYPSKYDAQNFNRVLQNNPDKYRVEIICEYPELTNDELNYLEIKEIFKHKFMYGEIPQFNFTIGGEGITGFIHTKETRQKMSENSARYWEDKTLSEDHKKNISDTMKNKCIEDDEYKNKIIKNLNHGFGENNSTWKGYARIIKKGFSKQKKQIYAIMFNGKTIKHSIHIHKLYKWFAKEYPNEYLYFEG